MPNLLDLMRPEDRERAVARFKRRMEGSDKFDNRISSEMYLLAELGYYFGWQAIRDVKENFYTMEEIYPILEGAKKVWYSKLVEQANITRAAVDSSNPLAKKHEKNTAFKSNMKPYVERAKQ
jgi:hypothetical protein